MLTWLINHQWKESTRSTLWHRKIITNIFLGFVLFITILNFLGLGFLLDKIIKDVAPEADPNITMLISSHDLNHVTEVCGRIAILDKGNIVKDLQTSKNTLKELETYFSV